MLRIYQLVGEASNIALYHAPDFESDEEIQKEFDKAFEAVDDDDEEYFESVNKILEKKNITRIFIAEVFTNKL